MRFFNRPGLCLALCGLAVVAGCGGSGGGASISTISATPPRYSQSLTLSLFGQGLDTGIEVTVDGPCSSVAVVAGATSASAQYTCLVTGLGPMTARVRSTDTRAELGSIKLETLAPRVSFTVTDGVRTGAFTVELDPVKAPLSTDNFLAYVNGSFYSNVIFHRVIDNFVVQAGGYVSGPNTKAATRPAIKLESNNGLKNLRGSIAMARTSVPDSATSQFYLNVKDNPGLDFGSFDNPDGYAVFGSVVQGQDVIDEIKIVPTRVLSTALPNLPVTDVRIILARQTQ